MDPYLEGELWSNFHTQFAVEITHQLNPRLSPRYVAVTEKYQNAVGPEEIGIAAESDALMPDVGISQSSGKPLHEQGVSLLEPPLQMETIISIPVNHVWIKILDVRRRLPVTAIEFLSPINKRGQGRLKYLKKRRKLLLSKTNLIEIDLLRKGKRIPMTEALPTTPYFAFVSRVRQRPQLDVWPIRLQESLPKIPVPLLPEDRDVVLDLQHAFTQVYDLGNMAQLVDYARPCDVPLPPDLKAWAETLTANEKNGSA